MNKHSYWILAVIVVAYFLFALWIIAQTYNGH